MEDENSACPYKFTNLCQEIMSMTISGIDPAPNQHKAYVFDAIIPILGGYKGVGATVTYRSDNSYAHELIAKMRKGIIPWLFHSWRLVCRYKLTMVQTFMESFNTDAALLARFSKFDANTFEVTTSFCDEDEYLKSMEADLRIDQGWAADDADNNKNNRITLEGA